MISLGLSVLLIVSFVLYVVLNGSRPVASDVVQGEYMRTHDNTRFDDSVIQQWLDEMQGVNDGQAGDEIQLTNEQVVDMTSKLLKEVYKLDD